MRGDSDEKELLLPLPKEKREGNVSDEQSYCVAQGFEGRR
jgi:hypothetical protein